MTFSARFVHKKLKNLEKYTQELEAFLQAHDDSAIISDPNNMHVLERLVQIIVDGMIDINQHFIRELELNLHEDLQSSFTILGESAILPKDFSQKLAPVTGVRNILVHQYEELDKELFVKNTRKNFSDFTKYQKHISAYMDKMDVQP